MPATSTGDQCTKPYDCPFVPYCRGKNPPVETPPLDFLPGSAGKALARRLRDKGHRTLLEPEPDEFTGKEADLYRRMQDAHRRGEGVLAADAAEKMEAFAYPRYFFDFEGIDLPIPRWKGTRPYEQIPFQWSCHIETAPGVFAHREFLDLSGNDPSEPCIEAMLATITDDDGPIFVYNKAYEADVLEKLAGRHPEHATPLRGFITRLVDLLPLVRAHFYHPVMKGSFSIKSVLPAIAPELGYEELDEVQDGTAAQLAYVSAIDPSVEPTRKRDIESHLRKYCRQDTWAMVEVAHFLAGRPRPERPSGM